MKNISDKITGKMKMLLYVKNDFPKISDRYEKKGKILLNRAGHT
jgi:hypothetical protein